MPSASWSQQFGEHPFQAVEATARRVAIQRREQGLGLDTTEEGAVAFAFEVGNALAGHGAGTGAAAMFAGATPSDEGDRPDADGPAHA